MSMWEPFTGSARHAISRAQEVAQMFASDHIGTEHIAFALAEGDGEVGRIMATAIDRDAIRTLLGGALTAPSAEMVFTPGAKRTIELAFESARRLEHRYIAPAHLALGVLGSEDCPPLVPGVDLRGVRASLDLLAGAEAGATMRWQQTDGENDPHPAAASILQALAWYPDLSQTGTRVNLTIQPPAGAEHHWTYLRKDDA